MPKSALSEQRSAASLGGEAPAAALPPAPASERVETERARL
jgi:hypothetical protein